MRPEMQFLFVLKLHSLVTLQSGDRVLNNKQFDVVNQPYIKLLEINRLLAERFELKIVRLKNLLETYPMLDIFSTGFYANKNLITASVTDAEPIRKLRDQIATIYNERKDIKEQIEITMNNKFDCCGFNELLHNRADRFKWSVVSVVMYHRPFISKHRVTIPSYKFYQQVIFK